VYTRISITNLTKSLVGIQTVVYLLMTVVLPLCIGVLLLAGIYTERPLLMLPAMIFSVCAGECCGVAECTAVLYCT
jgi:hypothetical protein